MRESNEQKKTVKVAGRLWTMWGIIAVIVRLICYDGRQPTHNAASNGQRVADESEPSEGSAPFDNFPYELHRRFCEQNTDEACSCEVDCSKKKNQATPVTHDCMSHRRTTSLNDISVDGRLNILIFLIPISYTPSLKIWTKSIKGLHMKNGFNVCIC